jgi:antitoxin HicB
MGNQYFGSDFDSFLEEEGMLAEVEARAIKKLGALEIQKSWNNGEILRRI